MSFKATFTAMLENVREFFCGDPPYSEAERELHRRYDAQRSHPVHMPRPPMPPGPAVYKDGKWYPHGQVPPAKLPPSPINFAKETWTEEEWLARQGRTVVDGIEVTHLIEEPEPRIQRSSSNVMVDKGYHWLPIDKDTPRGSDMMLIHRGSLPVRGRWNGDLNGWYTHWAPMPTFKD